MSLKISLVQKAYFCTYGMSVKCYYLEFLNIKYLINIPQF